MTKHFSYKQVFMFGWEKTKQHAWFVFLTAIIINLAVRSSEYHHIYNPMEGRVAHVPSVFSFIVMLMATLSITSVSMLISRGHGFSFQDLFNPLLSSKRVIKFLIVAVAYVVPVVIGVTAFVVGIASRNPSYAGLGALLLIPAVYYSVRLKFFPFIVLEHENASVKELLKLSYKLTQGKFLSVFIFLILAGVLNFFGALLLGVGLLATVPVTIFAMAHLYDVLKNHTA